MKTTSWEDTALHCPENKLHLSPVKKACSFFKERETRCSASTYIDFLPYCLKENILTGKINMEIV